MLIENIKKIMEFEGVDYNTALRIEEGNCDEDILFELSHHRKVFELDSFDYETLSYLYKMMKNKYIICNEFITYYDICSNCGHINTDDYNYEVFNHNYNHYIYDYFKNLLGKELQVVVDYHNIIKGSDSNKLLFINVYYDQKNEIQQSECNCCKHFYNDEGEYTTPSIDRLFDSYIWSHGVATGYSGSVSINDIVDRLTGLEENKNKWQICCSHKTQCIGAFGVYVRGHADVVSNIDLYSFVDKKGNRVFENTWRTEGLIPSPLYIDLTLWDHTETILSNYEIVGFWIKDWFLTQPGTKEFWEYLKELFPNKIFHMKGKRR